MGDVCETFLTACASATQLRWRGGELHRDAEPTGGPGSEGEGPVVCLGDALDDRQAEADTCVVATCAFGAPLERLGEDRDRLGTA